MKAKSVRKIVSSKQQLEKTSDIFSIINDGIEIDKVLADCSNVVFSLDKESKYILEILSKNGPLSEYQIAKIGNNYNLSRDSIRRRIYGTTLLPSLFDLEFITIVNTEKHRTGKEIKKFGLTFKGIIAVLTRINFEDIYITKYFYSKMKQLLGNKINIIELAILYAKYHIAFMMLWCKLNALDLTQNNKVSNFFLEGFTNHYLQIGFLKNIDNDIDWKNYIEAGIRYFVLKHTLWSLVKNIPKKNISHLLSDKRTKHIFDNLKRRKKDLVKYFFVRYFIKDWVMSLEIGGSVDIEKHGLVWFDYGNDEPLNFATLWWTYDEKMNKLYHKIAKELKIRKSDVKYLTYFKYKI